MSILLIKAGIKAKLDALVDDGVLGGATVTDIRKDPLAADIPSFPHAFLMPPSVESEVLDNRTVLRTYAFDVMLLFNAENLTGTTELEQQIESVLGRFDNDPTLGGSAAGGVLPVSSAPQPFQHNSRELVMVVIQLKAKEPVTLAFA